MKPEIESLLSIIISETDRLAKKSNVGNDACFHQSYLKPSFTARKCANQKAYSVNAKESHITNNLLGET
jgi:hypothetical protein